MCYWCSVRVEMLINGGGKSKSEQTTSLLRNASSPLFSPPLSSNPSQHPLMSLHNSLRSAGSVGSKRSVLKRGERIKLLKSRGLWSDGRLPTNLPKTKPE